MQQTGGSERTQQKQPLYLLSRRQSKVLGAVHPGRPMRARDLPRADGHCRPTRTPEARTPPAVRSQRRARRSAIHTAARGGRHRHVPRGDPASSRHTADTHTEDVSCVIPIV